VERLRRGDVGDGGGGGGGGGKVLRGDDAGGGEGGEEALRLTAELGPHPGAGVLLRAKGPRGESAGAKAEGGVQDGSAKRRAKAWDRGPVGGDADKWGKLTPFGRQLAYMITMIRFNVSAKGFGKTRQEGRGG
jgi:hypothetical protein